MGCVESGVSRIVSRIMGLPYASRKIYSSRVPITQSRFGHRTTGGKASSFDLLLWYPEL